MDVASSASKGIEVSLLPLVIGVTGHRDLRVEDREPLRDRVRTFLVGLRERYPSTPLVLLSPLAEGADRLVAQVALEAFPQAVRLVVPLPWPGALYDADGSTEVSRLELDQLLRWTDPGDCFELPLPDGVGPHDLQQGGAARNRQYAQVGAFIARHSQILLALWDGNDTGQEGGTAQVVGFHRDGVPEPYAPARGPLELPESGAVYQIVTPRADRDDQTDHPFAVHEYLPGAATEQGVERRRDATNPRDDDRPAKHTGEAREHFERILLHIDAFNRNVRRLAPRLKHQRDTAMGGPSAVDTSALPGPLAATLERYAERFATADAMARHFKRRTNWTLVGLFTLAFSAVVFFHLYAHLGRYRPFLVMYLAVLAGAYGWYLWAGDIPSPGGVLRRLVGNAAASRLWARRGGYKTAYLDYRALAEGLRVQYFWLLAGLAESPADYYLQNQRSELDWIRSGLRSWEAVEHKVRSVHARGQADPAGHPAAPQSIIKQWVHNQRRYYEQALRHDSQALQRSKRGANGFLLIGLLLAALLVLLPWLLRGAEFVDHERELLEELLIITASLAPFLVAVFEGYVEKMAYSEETKQYERMRGVFTLADRQLSASLDRPEDTRRILHDLGREALAEHGAWVLLQRERPIEPPRGG
jgi:hypothetical protein